MKLKCRPCFCTNSQMLGELMEHIIRMEYVAPPSAAPWRMRSRFPWRIFHCLAILDLVYCIQDVERYFIY